MLGATLDALGEDGGDDGVLPVPVVGEPLLGAPDEEREVVGEPPGEPVDPAGIPPCTVTTTAPGWKTICALHSSAGAAEVAVAVTARLCPGASVPDVWLSLSQATSGAADQLRAEVPALRNRIRTLSGSPSRWLMDT